MFKYLRVEALISLRVLKYLRLRIASFIKSEYRLFSVNNFLTKFLESCDILIENKFKSRLPVSFGLKLMTTTGTAKVLNSSPAGT